MKTKAIFAAAKQYKSNRESATKEKPWDKAPDAENLFNAMKEAGLTGLHAMAGTYIGFKPNKKMFIVDIGDGEIQMKTYKDWKQYFAQFK